MASASKQIPIKWGSGDYTGWFTGTFNIQSIPAGSGISYGYGWISNSAVASTYLHSFTIECELWQDSNKWEKTYKRTTTVPEGENTHWSFAIGADYIPSSSYRLMLNNITNNLEDDFLPSTLDFYINKPMANVTNVTLTGHEMYENVTVDFKLTSTDLVHYKIKMLDKVLLSGTTKGRQIIIPTGTIKSEGELTVELYSTSEYWDETFTSDVVTATTTINPITVETPSSVVITGNKMYENVVVGFKKETGSIVNYKVKMANSEIMTGKTSDTKITIPAGTIKTNGTLTVELYAYREYLGSTYSTGTVKATSTISPIVVDKPSNIRLMGSLVVIEQDSTFKWETSSTDFKSKLEVWQEGKCVLATTPLTATEYTLKGGTLTNTSPLTLRIKAVFDKNGYLVESAYTELKQNAVESIKPVITNFTLDSNNIDYSITISPTSTNCESYQVKLGSRIISNTLTIPKDTLNAGLNELTLIGINSGITGTLTKSFTLIQDEPVVYSIEPSNINTNVDMLSTIQFSTNEFVDTFDLFINGVRFATGTTQREFVVTGDTFIKGTNRIKVIAIYRGNRTATKEVEFTGYGKPNTPTLNIQEMYDTANPTFYWDSDNQEAYEIKVGEIEHKVVNTDATEHTVIEPLQNHTTYTLRLRTKNEYELWSDWVEKTFQTLYSDIDKPELALSTQAGGNVLIQVTCALADFKEMCIYKWNYNSKSWIEYANDLGKTDSLIDYLVKPNQEEKYKARVYNTDGAYNESDIQSITITSIKNYNLVDVLDKTKNHRLDFVSINFEHVSNSVSKIFAGKSKPRIFKSGTSYFTGSMTVKMINEEVEEFIQYIQGGSNIFCYRDYKGKKMYVSIDVKAINYINPFMQEIVLDLTEVNFNEYLVGNRTEITDFVYLDGQYYLDGTIDLRGWK